MKSIKTYLTESKDIYFTKQEINEIKKDIKDKNGFFIQFISDKIDNVNDKEIDDYLYNQCLNDDRCTAEFAAYISELIHRQNFSLEQVIEFIDSERLI